jgi:hypothetical protein
MRRLLPLTLAAFLLPASAALAAEAPTAITVYKGARSVSVKSAPKGVIVLGSAKGGKAAVAIARPRGAAAGKVVLKFKGKPKKVPAKSACKDLGKLLGRTLAGPRANGLGAVLAARACGKPDPAGAAGLLARLGLGPAQQQGPPNTPSNGGGSLQRPAKPAATPTPGPSVPSVPAACAESSYVSQGDDSKALFVGINQGCPAFTQVTVEVGAAITSCEAITSEQNFTCSAAGGKAIAKGGTTDMIDMPLGLAAAANCAVNAKVTFTLAAGGTQQLNEPIVNCGLLPVAPECSNGKDDDGDGMADARSGSTDPDPGCSGPDDTTENSDGDLMEDCDLSAGPIQGNQRYIGVIVKNCGSIQGVWFKPPGTPNDCVFYIGTGNLFTCDVIGTTADVTFAPTTDEVGLGTHLKADAACVPVTVAVTLAGGAVMSVHQDWCKLARGI